MNKQVFFILLLFLICMKTPVLCSQQTEKLPACGMYMEYPAADWREALPTGNGDMGAMLYGNVTRERVMLNHKRYFYHRIHKPLPDFSVYLPELRQMMDEGHYEEADKFFMNKIRESGYGNTRSGEYQPGFDLEVKRSSYVPFSGYGRTLNFETGEAEVFWNEGAVSFSRSVFVSRADDVVVMRLNASGKNVISGDFSLSPHDFMDAFSKSTLVSPDKLGLRFEEPILDPQGFIYISGQREDDNTTFGAVARIIPFGGSMKITEIRTGKVLSVENADQVLILIHMFYKGIPAERFNEARQILVSLSTDYDVLLDKHTAIHHELFSRCKVDLSAGTDRQLSNERLLLDAYKGCTPNALIERMYNYGRFLLICSSNPDGLPANLQGVWNGLYYPPWQGSFFFNENIEMNYWQALQGNMPEMLLSLVNLVETGVPDFKENAKKYYNCRGVLTPIRMIDDFGKKTGAISQDVFFTAGAGWLAQFFYDYWLFTGNDEFLRHRAVPYMKEVALFYEDFVRKDDKGQLKMYPSDSPENIPDGRQTQLSINATMDFAVMKEVLTNLVDACSYLKIEKDGVKRWRKLLSQIPAYQINEDGALREWMHPDFADNYHHRHQSHIYPLFPGFEISQEADSCLFDACRVAVEKRRIIGIESQTGWSLAHMANIYARLNQGNEALECLNLMSRSTIGANLFTYHNDYRHMGVTSSGHGWQPYQIDANLGYSAAVIEMLVYSNKEIIKLLPALPDQWPEGEIRGARCRGNFEVDIAWENGQLNEAVITSYGGKPCTVFYNGKSISLIIPKGKRVTLNRELKIQ